MSSSRLGLLLRGPTHRKLSIQTHQRVRKTVTSQQRTRWGSTRAHSGGGARRCGCGARTRQGAGGLPSPAGVGWRGVWALGGVGAPAEAERASGSPGRERGVGIWCLCHHLAFITSLQGHLPRRLAWPVTSTGLGGPSVPCEVFLTNQFSLLLPAKDTGFGLCVTRRTQNHAFCSARAPAMT